MAFENITVEVDKENVARITLNRTEQLNTFNTPMAKEQVRNRIVTD